MNKKITLIAFSSNDCEDEDLRVALFFKSILRQDTDDFKLLFWDTSELKKRFNIPEYTRNTIIREEVHKNSWHPAYTRNVLAMKANTDIICHVNSDNYYAPNFVSTLIKNMKGNFLVCCKKSLTTEKQWETLKTKDFITEEFVKTLKLNNASGDCQCMLKKSFLKAEGYNKLIINGKVTRGNPKKDKYKEDTHMLQYVRKVGLFEDINHKIKEKWIQDQTWIVHLYHPQRNEIYDAKKANGEIE